MLSTRGHQTLFFSTYLDRTYLAMRDGNYKYVYDADNDQTEVYDLSRDPGEHHSIQGSTPSAAIDQAQSDLLSWRRRVRQTYLGAQAP